MGSEREKGARQTLRAFYDQLDRKWQEAQKLLLSFDVPASAVVRIKTAPADHRGGASHHHELGFINHYGQWRICYGVGSVADPLDCLWTPIERCSVERRVEAARHFPELRDRLLQAAEAYAAEVGEAVEVFSRSLELEDEQSPAEEAFDEESAAVETEIANEQHPAEREAELARVKTSALVPLEPGNHILRAFTVPWAFESGEDTVAEEQGEILNATTEPVGNASVKRSTEDYSAPRAGSHSEPGPALSRWETEGGQPAVTADARDQKAA